REMVYIPFNDTLALFDNQRYLFCALTYNSPDVFLGFDTYYDYNEVINYNDQPVSILLSDNDHYATGFGTSITSSVTVRIAPFSSLSASVSSINTCIGCDGEATVTATQGNAPYTYLWSTGATVTTITGLCDSTYTVSVTDASGFTVTDTVVITPEPPPTATITPSNDTTVCGSINLSANPGASYLWSTGETTQQIVVTVSGSIRVTVFSVCGDSATSDTMAVTVNPLPTVNAGTDTTICQGNNTTLNATGGVSYSWSPAIGLSCTGCQSPVASPTSSTTYTVTVTDGNGCVNTDAVIVTVNTLPVANAGADVAICAGNSTILNASGGVSYSWSPAIGLSDPNISNPVASPTVTTIYTVTVTDGNGCTDSDPVTVTVNPLPTADAGADVAICIGSGTALSASGGVSYSWSPATGLSDPNIANPVASPTATTTYILTVDNGGCTDADTITVTVNPLPTANITGAASICEGELTILTASGGISYLWNTGAITSAITVSPVVNTDYNVIVTDGNGCSDTDTVSVTVNPNPSKPTIDQSGNILSCIVTASNYQWFYNGDTIPGATGQFHTATQSGFFNVTITDNNGCSATSDLLNVTVIGIKDAIAGLSIDIYPNPNRGEFTLEIILNGPEDLTVNIMNMVGQKVFTEELIQVSGTYQKLIDLKGFAEGVYQLQLITDKGTVHKNIVIE
ncbi:T9SS type A sorting domain-containing protein, partial [bacterium AH-315-M05]|nr:T9SS type A sorting domain-containing protein [bacterium AH-315-M05]